MGIRAWWRELTSTTAELDAIQLRDDAERAGAAVIEQVEQGQIQTLKGTIQSLVFRPEVSVPMLEAELFDGSGRITLVWMGRRKIRGINPGTKMAVTGRLVRNNGKLTMFNPNYSVLPNGHGG
jgi:RecG-like helicase